MLAGIICIIAIGLMICLVANERSKKNQSFSFKEDIEECEDKYTTEEYTRNSFISDWVILYCLFNFFK